MGISSINIAMGSSYGAYNQKLSESTKQKLEELGIQYNSNITETQAQKLISTFQAQKNAQNEKKNTSSNNNQQNDLFERAKKPESRSPNFQLRRFFPILKKIKIFKIEIIELKILIVNSFLKSARGEIKK